jgi:hypothetical protein
LALQDLRSEDPEDEVSLSICRRSSASQETGRYSASCSQAETTEVLIIRLAAMSLYLWNFFGNCSFILPAIVTSNFRGHCSSELLNPGINPTS